MTTILCIDDEPDLRNDVVEELQDSGYETLEACDGKDGLETILQEKPDLVLCDVTMPVMNGHELVRELRQNHPEMAELPFVFLSALADKQAQITGRAEGADDYLTKPVNYELLLATVEARLRQVERMEALKKDQMVRLYKAVATEQAGAGATQTAQSEAAVPVAAADDSGPGEDFTDLIEEGLTKQPKGLIAARVALAGLEEAKAKSGLAGPGVADKALQVAKASLRRNLGQRDVLRQNKSGDFFIGFADLDQRQAAVKAAQLKNVVREDLLGSAALRQNSGGVLDTLIQTDAEAYLLCLEDADAKSSGKGFALVRERMRGVAEAATARSKVLLKEILEEARLEFRAVKRKNRSPAPFCLSEFDDATRDKARAMFSCGNDPDASRCELDMLHLTKAREFLTAAAAGGKKGITVIAVHCSTLLDQRYREPYLKLCKTLPDGVLQSLGITVRNIPDDLAASRTQDAIQQLRPFAKGLAVEVGNLSMDAIDPEVTRVPIVVLESAGLPQLLANRKQDIRRFVDAVHEKRAKVLIENAPNVEAVEDLWRTGVDFIASERR